MRTIIGMIVLASLGCAATNSVPPSHPCCGVHIPGRETRIIRPGVRFQVNEEPITDLPRGGGCLGMP